MTNLLLLLLKNKNTLEEYKMSENQKIILEIDKEIEENDISLHGHVVDDDIDGIHWDFIVNAKSKNKVQDKYVEIELDLNCCELPVKNWIEIDNVSLSDEDTALFYTVYGGTCNSIDNHKIKISDRNKDTFRVEIEGNVDFFDIHDNCYDDNGDYHEQDDIETDFYLDFKVKFTGISIGLEHLKGKNYLEEAKQLLSEFIETNNLEAKKEYYNNKLSSIILYPKI